MSEARSKIGRFLPRGTKMATKWRNAVRAHRKWNSLRRWIMRDADLTPRARQIYASLKTAVARRRTA